MIFSISCCSSLLFLSYSLLLLLLLLLLLSLLSLLSLSYIIIIIYYHYYPMITITIIVSCYYCHFLPLCYYCYYYCYYCCNPFDSDTWWYLLTSLISLVWDWNIPSGSFGIPQEWVHVDTKPAVGDGNRDSQLSLKISVGNQLEQRFYPLVNQHNYGKITILNGTTHYFDCAIFNSYFDITRG